MSYMTVKKRLYYIIIIMIRKKISSMTRGIDDGQPQKIKTKKNHAMTKGALTTLLPFFLPIFKIKFFINKKILGS